MWWPQALVMRRGAGSGASSMTPTELHVAAVPRQLVESSDFQTVMASVAKAAAVSKLAAIVDRGPHRSYNLSVSCREDGVVHVTRDFDRDGRGKQEYFLVPVPVMQHLDITDSVVRIRFGIGF